MTENAPIACSLDASDLQHRLAKIAEVGAASLVSRDENNGRHQLRFRTDVGTRDRLAEIVKAEKSCCSFLDLSLTEESGELILTIEGPADAQPVSDELAQAFAGRGA